MSEFSHQHSHNNDPNDPELQDKAAGLMAGVVALFEERQVPHREIEDSGGTFQEMVLDGDDLAKAKTILVRDGFTEPRVVSLYLDSEYAYTYLSYDEEAVQPGSENLIVSLKYGAYDIDFWVAHLGDQTGNGLVTEKSCQVHVSEDEERRLGREIPDVADPIPDSSEFDTLIAMIDELKAA